MVLYSGTLLADNGSSLGHARDRESERAMTDVILYPNPTYLKRGGSQSMLASVLAILLSYSAKLLACSLQAKPWAILLLCFLYSLVPWSLHVAERVEVPPLSLKFDFLY